MREDDGDYSRPVGSVLDSRVEDRRGNQSLCGGRTHDGPRRDDGNQWNPQNRHARVNQRERES